MPFFTPPTAPTRPAAINPSHPGYSLFRHFRSWDAGINLFVVGGVVTTVEPDYGVVTPDRVYLGSHIYEVSEDEAAVLTAAGYALLEGYTPPTPSPPFEQPDDPDGPLLDPSLGFGVYGAGLYGEGHYGGAA